MNEIDTKPWSDTRSPEQINDVCMDAYSRYKSAFSAWYVARFAEAPFEMCDALKTEKSRLEEREILHGETLANDERIFKVAIVDYLALEDRVVKGSAAIPYGSVLKNIGSVPKDEIMKRVEARAQAVEAYAATMNTIRTNNTGTDAATVALYRAAELPISEGTPSSPAQFNMEAVMRELAPMISGTLDATREPAQGRHADLLRALYEFDHPAQSGDDGKK